MPFILPTSSSFARLPYRTLFHPPSRHYSTHPLAPNIVLEPKKPIRVRLMTKNDLQLVKKWAVKEDWNPGKYEVDPLYAADPSGYRLLEVDGKPVASLASVKHSPHFAFLGLYIVKPEFRGLGYGKLLWDVSMGTLKECNSIALNGVLSQAENYRREGFVPANLNTRWCGKSFWSPRKTEPAKDICLKSKDNVSFTQLVDYDAKIFSTPRAAFLKQWLAMPESHVLAAMDSGILRGYAVVSAAQTGHKIAPLFADNEAIAEKLYGALCQWIGNQGEVYLDTSAVNPLAATLAQRFGLTKTFDTLRMYKGEVPTTEDSKIFGLTSLEIG